MTILESSMTKFTYVSDAHSIPYVNIVETKRLNYYYRFEKKNIRYVK